MKLPQRRATRTPQPADAFTHEQRADRGTRYLYWWLLIALFFEYARPGSFVPGLDALRPYSLLPGGLLLVSSYTKGLRPLSEIFPDSIARWLLVYFGLICMSLVFAIVQTWALNMVIATLGYVIYFLLVCRIVTSRERMLGVIATLLFAHLFLMAMNPQALLDPSARHYIIGASFMGDPNDFSMSLCILLPLVMELAISSKRWYMRLAWWGGVFVVGLMIIASSSRGAALGLGAVLVYLWLISPRKLLTLIGVTLLATILLSYASDLFFERMATLGNYQEEGSAMGRITAWKAGTQMMLDHPLTGVGAGNFATAFGAHYIPKDVVGPYPWLTAHSIYFLIIGELGLPGIVTLLVLILGNLLANTRLRRTLQLVGGKSPSEGERDDARMLYMLNAGLIGFAIAGAFLSAAYYPHIFVITGLMVSQRALVRQRLVAAGHTDMMQPRSHRGRAGRGTRFKAARAARQPTR